MNLKLNPIDKLYNLPFTVVGHSAEPTVSQPFRMMVSSGYEYVVKINGDVITPINEGYDKFISNDVGEMQVDNGTIYKVGQDVDFTLTVSSNCDILGDGYDLTDYITEVDGYYTLTINFANDIDFIREFSGTGEADCMLISIQG